MKFSPLRLAQLSRKSKLNASVGLVIVVAFVTGAILMLDKAHAAGSYEVVNNVIHNPDGQVFYPHGVDRPSLEWSCSGQNASNGSAGIPASDYTTMKTTWGANTVRIALNQDYWLPTAHNYCSSYQHNIANTVSAARAAGLVVILDLHWSDTGNLANPSPGQQCMADANSVSFWNQVAGVYKGDSGVWFELYNEPHDITWSVWQNGGSLCGFQAVGMQQLVNTVRATGANNIVVVGGIGYASSLNGLPLLSGTNIAYAVHPYAADINGGNSNAWSTGDWDNRFGYLAAKAPVIATEFGHTTCGASTYDQAILDYFRTHGIGYTAWAWYSGGCGFPSLIDDQNGHCFNGGCVTQPETLAFAHNTKQMTTVAYTGATPTPIVIANGDINGDGKVNITDLSMLLSHWNSAYPSADFNNDGSVNVTDLSVLLSHWSG